MALRVTTTVLKTIAALPLLAALATTARAAEGHAAPADLSPFIGLPISNSILTSLLITTLLIIGIRLMVGTPKIVPGRGQAIFEGLITTLKEMLEPIVGKKAMPGAFPVLLCLFVFILIHNWSGLLPFVGTAGWGHTDPETGKFIVDAPLLRPHTSEANGTLALSLFSFGAWLILIFKYAGPKLIWHDLFGNKAGKGELHPGMYYFLTVVFFLVGIIELVSIGMRPITLSARLFGNVFGGENLLHATGFIFIFYFLEIIVGLVQAFVFTLLSSVYIGLICNHGDDHGHGHDDHGHGHEADGHAHAEPAKH
jgi:F-type H+-transporting ATPase subunit a